MIRRRYGLDGHPPQTQRQVAAAYGISRSYVSRIEKRALAQHILEKPRGDARPLAARITMKRTVNRFRRSVRATPETLGTLSDADDAAAPHNSNKKGY